MRSKLAIAALAAVVGVAARPDALAAQRTGEAIALRISNGPDVARATLGPDVFDAVLRGEVPR